MAMKDKRLLLLVLAVVTFSIFFSSFWNWALHLVERAVALGLVSSPGLAVFVAEICGVHFLS
jgi:hypothetical protein